MTEDPLKASSLKRQFLRFKNVHLVHFTVVDGTGNLVGEGLGKTLNVSMGGALIGIEDLIDDEAAIVLLEMAFDDRLFTLKTRVVFTRRTGNRRSEIGVQFLDVSEQMKDDIGAFLSRFNAETGQRRALLREPLSGIRNVVLTLSKEHRIINDYVAVCRNMLEKRHQGDTVQSLLILFQNMQKDLDAHFDFEERILFQAAVSGDCPKELYALVETLKADHNAILRQLTPLIAHLESLVVNRRTMDQVSHGKIDSFMILIRHHARNEMLELFPRIDADPNKIIELNRLISEKKNRND
ncbi:hypothetical protein JCM14469_22560 [Desulfatiferula olefinivorans]